jgi:hypothetical protein
MATIIVEDGSIVTGANSYNSEAELTTYAADRGITLTGTPAVLLIQSMDYTETRDFKGTKSTEAQGLQWPRHGVTIDGYYVDSNEIPKELKSAQLATCVSIDAGFDPLSTVDRATKREKLDSLEIEYQENASSAAMIRSVSIAFAKLVNGTMGGLFARNKRA